MTNLDSNQKVLTGLLDTEILKVNGGLAGPQGYDYAQDNKNIQDMVSFIGHIVDSASASMQRMYNRCAC